MATIYIIIATSGEYSNRIENYFAAYKSQDRAEKVATKLEELQKYNNVFSEKLRAFRDEREKTLDLGILKSLFLSEEFSNINKRYCLLKETGLKEELVRLQREHYKKLEDHNKLLSEVCKRKAEFHDELKKRIEKVLR